MSSYRSVELSRRLGALVQAHDAGAIPDDQFEALRIPLRSELLAAAEAEALAASPMAIDVPIVVPGELIEAAWGNMVRADLLELYNDRRALGPHHIRFVPATPADGGAGAWTTLATLGSIPVPAAASAAIANVHINGLIATTNGLPVYIFRTVIGGADSGGGDGVIALSASLTQRERMSYASNVAAPPVGAQNVIVQVSRTAGTGAVRVDTNTIFTAHIQFRG